MVSIGHGLCVGWALCWWLALVVLLPLLGWSPHLADVWYIGSGSAELSLFYCRRDTRKSQCSRFRSWSLLPRGRCRIILLWFLLVVNLVYWVFSVPGAAGTSGASSAASSSRCRSASSLPLIAMTVAVMLQVPAGACVVSVSLMELKPCVHCVASTAVLL